LTAGKRKKKQEKTLSEPIESQRADQVFHKKLISFQNPWEKP